MGFPLGDIIRKLGIGGWIGKIFRRTKGISLGGIDLNENPGPNISKPGESKFDRIPSRPKPPLRVVILALLLIPACAVTPPETPPPPCDSESHIWGDGLQAYHLPLDARSPVLVNTSSYTPDAESWNALETPLALRGEGEGFSITIIEGGDRQSGWLGMASINIDGDGHIQSAEVTMNKSILDDYTTATAAHVLCQEIGHLLGLEHNRRELDTCMNDCADAPDFRACLNLEFGETPNDHDGEQLKLIYAHAAEPPIAPCTGQVILHTFPVVEDPEEDSDS